MSSVNSFKLVEKVSSLVLCIPAQIISDNTSSLEIGRVGDVRRCASGVIAGNPRWKQKEFDPIAKQWDNPTVPIVKKLDSKRRVVFPDLFEPGDVFIEESTSEGRVVFSLVVSDSTPVAPTKIDGDLLVIDTPVQRDLIKKAIREERDRK